jgi:hypothetical protein
MVNQGSDVYKRRININYNGINKFHRLDYGRVKDNKKGATA